MIKYKIDGEEHLAASAEVLFQTLWKGSFDPEAYPSLVAYMRAYRDRLYQVKGVWIDDADDPEAFLLELLKLGVAEIA